MVIALPLPLMNFTDANVYVDAAREYLFRPVMGRTAGYPLFLRLGHDVSGSPIFPVILQHMAALLVVFAVYVIALAVRVPRTLAALAAAVLALSVDWIWLEHQLLTEVVGTTLAVLAVAVIAIPSRLSRSAVGIILLAVVAAVLAMAGAIVRPALLAALPGIGLAMLLLPRTRFRSRIVGTLVLVVVCIGLLEGYIKVQQDHTGFHGIVGSELDLGQYPGVAPFANCKDFVVPRGARALCETTPPASRPTSDSYYWDSNTAGRRFLAAHPGSEPLIRLWASRAAHAQSGELLKIRLTAFQRLFGLGGRVQPVGDQGPALVSLRNADAGAAAVTVAAIKAYYGSKDAPNHPARSPYGVLIDIQPWTRPPGLLLLAALVVGIVGAALGRGIARRATITIGVTGWVPLLYATWAGGLYNWRYVLPGIPLIALATVAALAAILARRRGAVDGTREDGRPPSASAAGGGW